MHEIVTRHRKTYLWVHATHATRIAETCLSSCIVGGTLLGVGKDLVSVGTQKYWIRTRVEAEMMNAMTYAWVTSLKSSGSPPLSGWSLSALGETVKR